MNGDLRCPPGKAVLDRGLDLLWTWALSDNLTT